MAVCRRDLGSWRIGSGDDGGIADLAAGLQVLSIEDPRQAVTGLRLLAEVLDRQGVDKDAALMAAVADQLADSSAIDEALLSTDEIALLSRCRTVLAELASTARTASRR